jgi:pre-mRNA-splicing factor CDC5/CEF1
MAKDAKKANKIEKRLMTLNAGYEKRSKQLIKEIQTMWEEYQKAQQQKACFEKLEAQEAVALPARITALTEDLQLVKKRESELQQRYARLKFELDEVRVTGNI